MTRASASASETAGLNNPPRHTKEYPNIDDKGKTKSKGDEHQFGSINDIGRTGTGKISNIRRPKSHEEEHCRPDILAKLQLN